MKASIRDKLDRAQQQIDRDRAAKVAELQKEYAQLDRKEEDCVRFLVELERARAMFRDYRELVESPSEPDAREVAAAIQRRLARLG